MRRRDREALVLVVVLLAGLAALYLAIEVWWRAQDQTGLGAAMMKPVYDNIGILFWCLAGAVVLGAVLGRTGRRRRW